MEEWLCYLHVNSTSDNTCVRGRQMQHFLSCCCRRRCLCPTALSACEDACCCLSQHTTAVSAVPARILATASSAVQWRTVWIAIRQRAGFGAETSLPYKICSHPPLLLLGACVGVCAHSPLSLPFQPACSAISTTRMSPRSPQLVACTR